MLNSRNYYYYYKQLQNFKTNYVRNKLVPEEKSQILQVKPISFTSFFLGRWRTGYLCVNCPQNILTWFWLKVMKIIVQRKHNFLRFWKKRCVIWMLSLWHLYNITSVTGVGVLHLYLEYATTGSRFSRSISL